MAEPVSKPTPLPHLSHSALSTWITCGKAYELARILNLPTTPAYALAGGLAVHLATERYDRMHLTQSV
jgi:hypothetical protein